MVYVSTVDPRESSIVPTQVNLNATKMSKSRANKNYAKADGLHEKIISAGYRLTIFFSDNFILLQLEVKHKTITFSFN